MKTFKLSISTPIGKNYEVENAVSINAYILEGRIGVMANHSPLISSLRISDFSIDLEDGTQIFGVVDKGVFNVTKDSVSILTTRFHFSDEVDVKKTEVQVKQIEDALQHDVKEAEQKSLSDRLQYAKLQVEIANKK